jgi:hypothetical protein
MDTARRRIYSAATPGVPGESIRCFNTLSGQDIAVAVQTEWWRCVFRDEVAFCSVPGYPLARVFRGRLVELLHILADICLPDRYDKSRKRENLGARVIFP